MRVLIPLPAYGFDPTESAVPWKQIIAASHTVTFTTPQGQVAAADRRMVTGEELPRLFRASLRAEPAAVQAYTEMAASPEFRAPIAYSAIRTAEYGALLLPGGHDKGMREYLESAPLQSAVAEFFAAGKPVAAICHGTLLAARSRVAADPRSAGGDSVPAQARSVLWGRRTTGLTRRQEMTAYWLTRWRLGDYYRTYSTPMMDELISRLQAPSDYDAGPGFPIPAARDSDANLAAGFTVRDGNYLSARWPGDAYRFAHEFVGMLV